MTVSFIGGENHRSVAADSTPLACAGFELTTVVVMDTDSTGSCIYIYTYIQIYDHDHDHDDPLID